MVEQAANGDIVPEPDRSIRHLAEYDRQRQLGYLQVARKVLLGALAGSSEQDWLACGRALVLHDDLGHAITVFTSALIEHPASSEIRLAQAGLFWQTGLHEQAELVLLELLAQNSDHVGATFLLVRLLKDQGRLDAAASVMRALFRNGPHDTDLVIQAVELLDDCNRQKDAAAICEAEIAAGSTDARLYAYAGMLEIQLGEFELARLRYAFALNNCSQAMEWNIPIGLVSLQHYKDSDHPDFKLLRAGLQQPGLSSKARTSILFALGKANDDIAAYAQAAQYLRQANAMAHSATTWSRKNWRRAVDARIARTPPSWNLSALRDWSPLFIVGVPRSGTTLVAELLSRHPDVCNRGELAWLPALAKQLSLADKNDRTAFERAAAIYQVQLRQDDSDAHWFIDKQPLNLLRIDLIMTLWPNARIVHCQRNCRDTALSLWSQYFTEDEQGYAYDFTNIINVIQGCNRLMAHWQKYYATSIYTVRYEQLAHDPRAGVAALADWLKLPNCELFEVESGSTSIRTASLWQARQPVHTRSVERWRHYALYLPELFRLSPN